MAVIYIWLSICVGRAHTTVVHAVPHEIQGPNLIELLMVLERLSFPGDDALLGFTLEVQLHRAIHTVDLLMVPGLAVCS